MFHVVRRGKEIAWISFTVQHWADICEDENLLHSIFTLWFGFHGVTISFKNLVMMLFSKSNKELQWEHTTPKWLPSSFITPIYFWHCTIRLKWLIYNRLSHKSPTEEQRIWFAQDLAHWQWHVTAKGLMNNIQQKNKLGRGWNIAEGLTWCKGTHQPTSCTDHSPLHLPLVFEQMISIGFPERLL